ncbi:MAG: toll/interleukin-1 receptor domain-containing protein [Sphaerospermopsis sp.]|nr:toll/interleukin-1 receptor domain-containing protein [Sphaerospermopsis sp.]
MKRNRPEVYMKPTHDIFLSHASEDKEQFVDILYKKLTQAQYKVWYDKEEIKWGDKLDEKIYEGLRASQYGIVVISHNYFAAHKIWTFLEFKHILAANNILPILHGIDMQTIELEYPEVYKRIKDWLAISSEQGVDYIVKEANKKIGKNTIDNIKIQQRKPIYQPLLDEIGYFINGIGYFITHGSEGGIIINSFFIFVWGIFSRNMIFLLPIPVALLSIWVGFVFFPRNTWYGQGGLLGLLCVPVDFFLILILLSFGFGDMFPLLSNGKVFERFVVVWFWVFCGFLYARFKSEG